MTRDRFRKGAKELEKKELIERIKKFRSDGGFYWVYQFNNVLVV